MRTVQTRINIGIRAKKLMTRGRTDIRSEITPSRPHTVSWKVANSHPRTGCQNICRNSTFSNDKSQVRQAHQKQLQPSPASPFSSGTRQLPPAILRYRRILTDTLLLWTILTVLCSTTSQKVLYQKVLYHNTKTYVISKVIIFTKW